MKHFVNILFISDNKQDQLAMKEILGGNGNILLFCDTLSEARVLLARKRAGIILLDIDTPKFTSIEDFQKLLKDFPAKVSYSVLVTKDNRAGLKMIKGYKSGMIDIISRPFNPLLIQAKIDVFKSLYYKDTRIIQLLENIFPENVLHDLNQYGKFSPKRVDNGVVLFTDFVDFSVKAKSIKPIKLLNRLEYYFTAFDKICRRYNVEKIKTIGDAYMAIAGVNEDNAEPILRACFAAIEMREFVRNEKELAKATKKQDYWEIRIGVHAGPLVAGIIGTSRYSFDVWGDSVNIAARAQQSSGIDQVAVTESIIESCGTYFDYHKVGEIPIKKRGGLMTMYELINILPEYSLYNEGKVPSVKLRVLCEIQTVDFDLMRHDVLNKLKSMLPEEVVYHDIGHTLNVENAVRTIGKFEGVTADEMLLLRTAALFHDTGFIFQYEHNEPFGVRLMQQMLPKYGFSDQQILEIEGMILATDLKTEPVGLLQEILCDADHDYLGRADYYVISQKLVEEMRSFGKEISEEDWLMMQIRFFESIHKYYTVTSQNIREKGKQNRLKELKLKLASVTSFNQAK